MVYGFRKKPGCAMSNSQKGSGAQFVKVIIKSVLGKRTFLDIINKYAIILTTSPSGLCEYTCTLEGVLFYWIIITFSSLSIHKTQERRISGCSLMKRLWGDRV